MLSRRFGFERNRTIYSLGIELYAPWDFRYTPEAIASARPDKMVVRLSFSLIWWTFSVYWIANFKPKP